jgi:hypothetical protein
MPIRELRRVSFVIEGVSIDFPWHWKAISNELIEGSFPVLFDEMR